MGKLGYASWDCAALAIKSNAPETEIYPLFEQGYELFSQYLKAGEDGLLTPENTKEVPIALRWYLVPSPSIDFSLGYAWALFLDYSEKETAPDLEDAPYEQISELSAMNATNLYRERNCDLLLDR